MLVRGRSSAPLPLTNMLDLNVHVVGVGTKEFTFGISCTLRLVTSPGVSEEEVASYSSWSVVSTRKRRNQITVHKIPALRHSKILVTKPVSSQDVMGKGKVSSFPITS